MSGLILRTEAIKIINKGGGIKQTRSGAMIRWEKVTGSDYIVFICPHCNRRNKRSIYEADYANQGILSFKCKMCRGDIEVSRRAIDLKDTGNNPLIVSPEEYEMERRKNARS